MTNKNFDSCRSMQAGVARVAEVLPDLPVEDIVLSRMLHIVAGGLEAAEDSWLKPHKLGISEFRTLMMLFSSPGQQSHPSELCERAWQKPTNMTRIIDGLLRRGLVSRRASDEDRRRVILKVTPQGARLIRRLLPRLHPNVTAMFHDFSPQEQRQLRALLEKLSLNIDSMKHAPK